jgi:hypothetical protein
MSTQAGDDLINDTAWLVDKCRKLATETDEPEVRRLWNLARTHYENAGVYVAKAATYEPPQ